MPLRRLKSSYCLVDTGCEVPRKGTPPPNRIEIESRENHDVLSPRQRSPSGSCVIDIYREWLEESRHSCEEAVEPPSSVLCSPSIASVCQRHTRREQRSSLSAWRSIIREKKRQSQRFAFGQWRQLNSLHSGSTTVHSVAAEKALFEATRAWSSRLRKLRTQIQRMQCEINTNQQRPAIGGHGSTSGLRMNFRRVRSLA